MKIAIACDHGALELKNTVKKHLEAKGHEVVDFGTHTLDSCDYPDFAAPAAKAVASGECEKGNFGDAHDTPYIIELSNGTKFLCFINDSLGGAEVLSEWGETANTFAARGHHDKVKRNINALNNY